MDISTISGLLYHHVDVITKHKRRPDFQEDFVDLEAQSLIYSGYLKAIDPHTKSVVLCRISSDKLVNDNALILGHNICDIKLSNYKSDDAITVEEVEEIIQSDREKRLESHPLFDQRYVCSKEELDFRRDLILNWLRKNRLPVSCDFDNGDIIVCGRAKIKPPYKNTKDFICPTRVVLKRLQHIVNSMPDNHEENMNSSEIVIEN